MKIPDSLLDYDAKLECYYKKAMEFAKVNHLEVYEDSSKVKLHALQVIHDAIVEGN